MILGESEVNAPISFREMRLGDQDIVLGGLWSVVNTSQSIKGLYLGKGIDWASEVEITGLEGRKTSISALGPNIVCLRTEKGFYVPHWQHASKCFLKLVPGEVNIE